MNNLLSQLGTFKTIECPSPNCYIIYFENGRILQSYNSLISIVLNGKTYLSNKYRFSSTTGKHRNIFLNESLKETEDKLKNGEYTLLENE